MSDNEEEGTFVDYFSNKPIANSANEMVLGELDGGSSQNCGLMFLTMGGWVDWACEGPESQEIMCMCQHPQQAYLTLRGLCPDSNIGQYYVARNYRTTLPIPQQSSSLLTYLSCLVATCGQSLKTAGVVTQESHILQF